jgi:hypothetical protein
VAIAPDPAAAELPELAAVYWRPRADAQRLARRGTRWTLSTLAHVVPFVAVGALLVFLQPLAFPVTLAALAHAWGIPELYAQRGANVVRPKRRRGAALPEGPEQVALGLLGDLTGHEARELHGRTGLVLERGGLGTWLVGPAGALLVTPGGRRVHCWCVGVDDPALPTSDRVAHLLLALRADEAGFATVSNLAFSGAGWRVRRRLDARQRPALDRARAVARGGRPAG